MWTAVDDCGTSVQISQTITVEDHTAPTVTFTPADETIECPATPAFGEPTFSDACDATLSVTFLDASLPAVCPAVSVTRRTWTAVDDCGNSVQISQTITVEDHTAPTVTFSPADQPIVCPATTPRADHMFSDACDATL